MHVCLSALFSCFLFLFDSFYSQLLMKSLSAQTESSSWVAVSILNPLRSLHGPTGLILGKLLLISVEDSVLGSDLVGGLSAALTENPLTLLIVLCVSALWHFALLCITFVSFWLTARLNTGTQVLALLSWACGLCFRASRSGCRGSWDMWGPQKSRSLALNSMLIQASSLHCALWAALTLRWMALRDGGWWGPLFFIRALVAFSLSSTFCSAARKVKFHLQQKQTDTNTRKAMMVILTVFIFICHTTFLN